jgi:hypothetical protein
METEKEVMVISVIKSGQTDDHSVFSLNHDTIRKSEANRNPHAFSDPYDLLPFENHIE